MLDLSKVSCCLITKDATYPREILDHLAQFPFGEFLILTHSDSPYRKHELFAKAKFDLIYYQDDDAICPVRELAVNFVPGRINLAMKLEHFNLHYHSRATMGLGWGAFFPKEILKSLQKYVDVYGEDDVFKRETERILTFLNAPQNRIVAPIIDLPSAYAEDRLWRQPEHQKFKMIAEERSATLL